MSAPLDLFSLNPPQREAVLHPEGPLLVLAGAGSGKTRVIVYRIARLLQEGLAPERILAVTFTNKAAEEMRERLRALVGRKASKVVMSTFHALGLMILREEHAAAGLRPNFCIYDTSDLMSLVRDLMRQVQVADRRLDVQRVLDLLLAAKRERADEVTLRWGDDYELAAYDLYPRFLAQMQAFGAIDFDDLILRSQDVLQRPDVRARWQRRFAHVLVDEYQDTSPDQLALLRGLLNEEANICAVGDDDQAIYAWRGAAVDNILRFGAHFAGTREVVLDQNYRSTPTILEAANAVIANNAVRKQKTLWSALRPGDPVEVVACANEEEEATFVAETIHGLVFEGARMSEIAVLFRANTQGKYLEEVLRSERLPLRVLGGQALFDRKDVRDGMAFLTLAHNPGDELALRRIVNVPPRGLGPASLERLAGFAAANGCSLWDAVGRAAEVDGLPRAARQGAAQLAAAYARYASALVQGEATGSGQAAQALLDALEVRGAIEGAGDADGVRARRLDSYDAFVRSFARYAERHGAAGKQALAAFLRAASLRSDAQEEADGEPGVTLMTLHAAKGLEFPYVFLVGMEEDLLPHRRAIDESGENAAHALSEERRLCYVGMTRAKRRLFLSYAKERRRSGRAVPRTPSRFLNELPKGSQHVVHKTWGAQVDVVKSAEKSEAMAKAFFARMRAQLGIDDEQRGAD